MCRIDNEHWKPINDEVLDLISHWHHYLAVISLTRAIGQFNDYSDLLTVSYLKFNALGTHCTHQASILKRIKRRRILIVGRRHSDNHSR